MICIPITANSHKKAMRDIERGCVLADCIELRMDLITDGILPELITVLRSSSATVKIIVTCRKKEEAASAGEVRDTEAGIAITTEKKMAILREAIDLGADFVDIELSEGRLFIEKLQADCKAQGDFTKIIISYHNLENTPALPKLKKIFNQCRELKPAVVKIVTTAVLPEDNLEVMGLIPYAQKQAQKIIALCMGEAGRMSRVMSPLLDGFLTFAALDAGAQSAPGQLTVQEMREITKLMTVDKLRYKAPGEPTSENQTGNYILLGNPVKQSLSPIMHNAALADLSQDGRYNAFCVYDLAAVVSGMRGMDIHGASVTIPYKVAVMELLDDIDEDALKIGAVNTISNDNGRLTGFNTDWRGLILTLKEAMTIKDKKFVIIGAGGTARAAAYGIIKEGGTPIIVNRSAEKGKILSDKFNCPFYSLAEIGKIKADCLINTTPVGMYPCADGSPVDTGVLAGYKYVMDVIYNPLTTKLLQDAKMQGCHTFLGLDMFVHQGACQIELWTGKEPNRELMKKVVLERLNKIAE
jgi:shikimate dehydrogenase/3-dehydroquinate dehydratase type I